jgi:hypothetical protein
MGSARRLERQRARDLKIYDDIMSGRVKIGVCREKPSKRARPNRIPGAGGEGAAMAERQEMIGRLALVYRRILPGLLWKLEEVEDPRGARNREHSLAVLLLHAILMFAFHVESRRQANKALPAMWAAGALRAVFPEMATMPHADTVARLLEGVDAGSIQDARIKMFREHVCTPKFRDKYAKGLFVVAVDGTQSFSRGYCWDSRALCRHVGEQKAEQYYVSFLDAALVLENGAVLPICTETIENDGRLDGDDKQDCELKAFYRMAERLHGIFGSGGVVLVADGLYAGGPAISICNKYKWDFMIGLKDGCMPAVWEDFEGLAKAEPSNSLDVQWGGRFQAYRWANGIDYAYGRNSARLKLNVVVCHEIWDEPRPRSGGKPRREFRRWAWLSSERLAHGNVFHRCVEIARRRWRIESGFNAEKNQGYSLGHCFSYNWNAMKAYHHLMKIARFFNAMAARSGLLAEYTVGYGIQGLFQSFRAALSGGGLDEGRIRAAAAARNARWKMAEDDIFLVRGSP